MPCFDINAPCTAGGADLVNYYLAADTISVSNTKDTITTVIANVTATQFSTLASEIDIISGL